MILLVGHFAFDFGLQTHEQATRKSTSNTWLLYHVGVYSLCWFILMLPILGPSNSFLFAITTLTLHFWTDYCTSRLSKRFFDKDDFHNGFVVIGFDQMLHYIQLYLTLKFLL